MLTAEQVRELRAAFGEASAGGEPRLLTPLPRGVRLRLWRDKRIDGVAVWLTGRRQYHAAMWLWRAARLWRG
jgi:hypothetical protein